jgi:hypothetical protein
MTCGDMRSMVQEAAVDFPEYDLRRAACARDPLAVVEAFRVHILLRLSALLGVRMCPQCPRCNANDHGCQDIFGNSARPVGGVLGAMMPSAELWSIKIMAHHTFTGRAISPAPISTEH